MDPLSITLSVFALIDLTRKVISYAKQTKDAPKERTKVLQEAASLVGLLGTLKDLLEDCDSQDPWLRAMSGLVIPDGPLDQYKVTLEMVVAKTMSSHGHGKVRQALAWQFSKEEVTSLLSQIERVKSLMQIALEIDHIALTRAIHPRLDKIQDDLADLKTDTSAIVNTVSVIESSTTALQDHADTQRKRELLEWVCSADYYEQHRDYIERRQADTGQWFLQEKQFQDWLQSEESTLFCPGIPGAGKTIMAALVIDHLLRNGQHRAEHPVVFIYCNYKRQDEQSLKHMLSNLLRQVVDVQEGVPQLVQDFYESHARRRTTPSTEEVEQILTGASKGLRRLTILVDGLDECEAQTCDDLLSRVEALCEQCKVRWLATSRFLPVIQSHPVFRGKPMLEVRASDQDVEKYVRLRASRLRIPIMSKPDLLENLVSSIVKATGGMFLLSQLLMDSFKDKLTVKEVKTALRTLPKGSDAYDVAYSAAMGRIFAQGKGPSEVAKKMLSWILCARRPLSTLELLHALAIEVGDDTIDEDSILEPELLLTICAGLVTIDEQSDSVRFIHYTTQEYLQRNRERWLPCADVEIARLCTAYLSIDDLSAGPCSSAEEYGRRVETLGLLDYAAVHWGSHMNLLVEADYASELGGQAESEALAFLSNVEGLSSASQALFMSGKEWYSEDAVAEQGAGFSGSHWIGRFGLALLFRQWDSSGEAQWDSCDFLGRTPLSWAAGEGHAVVMKLLLETGSVNVNSRDNMHGQTPLTWAVEEGQEAVVKLLLSTKLVEVDSRDYTGYTPLFWAVRSRNEAIVKLLLNTGKVDVESKKKTGSETPLSWAVKKGNEVMVKLLLDFSQVDVEAKNEDGQTLLSLASEKGQEATVKLLLGTRKPDVNSKNRSGRTPLLLAAQNEHEAVVKLLLDTGGVDVDSADDSGQTPLVWAIRCGHEGIVKILLDSGKVDVNSRDFINRTPLLWATGRGYEGIVKLLLETGRLS